MKLTIYGNPIGKKRPRFARRGKFVTTYNDQETEEGKFLAMAKTQFGDGPPLSGPLRVDISAFIQRPKAHYGTGRNSAKLKASAPKYPESKKPDRDNIDKFVLDALEGLCWVNDVQVCDGRVMKRWADEGLARVEVCIEEL